MPRQLQQHRWLAEKLRKMTETKKSCRKGEQLPKTRELRIQWFVTTMLRLVSPSLPPAGELFESYGPMVYRRCRAILGEHEAADAVQEVFMRVVEKQRLRTDVSGDRGVSFRPWSLKVLASGFLLAETAVADGRHAIVIGTNEGLASEPVLEFAESDARRMAQTFVDVRAMSRDRVTVLTGSSLDTVKSTLRHAPAADELWVFISGHAGADGVHVRGGVWSWKELRAALEALPAQRRVVLIDACNSGAVLTAKGVSLESQLQLSARSNLRGLVMLVSSGANELSYESRRLKGSPFAHFLASGLRRAADRDRNGRVTLAETYAYLSSRTVAASLDGGSGPQHPEQAGWYRGSGEWVLSERVGDQGELRLSDPTLGTCYALDDQELRVLADRLRSSITLNE